MINKLKKSITTQINNLKDSKYSSQLNATALKHIRDFIGLEAFYQYLKSSKMEPTIIMAMVPLYGVQSYEISRSYDTLKYRAVRGIFMAHQKGGNLAMKVDLLLYGQDQVIWYNIIKSLQIYGEGTDITNNALVNSSDPTTKAAQVAARKANQIKVDATKEGKQIAESKNIKGGEVLYDTNDSSYLDQKIRKTFTIFTTDEILFNMYIETVSISRSVKDGIRVLSVSIMCRQFNEPDTIEIDSYTKKGTPVLVEDKTVTGGYKTTVVKKLVKRVIFSKKPDSTYIDFGINYAHSLAMSLTKFSYNKEMMRNSTFRGYSVYNTFYTKTTINNKTKSEENLKLSIKTYSSNPKETAFVEFTLPSPPIVQTNRKLYYDQNKNRTDHIIFYVNNGAPQILWNYYPITDDIHFNQVAQNIANNTNITLSYQRHQEYATITMLWKDKTITIQNDSHTIQLQNNNYIIYNCGYIVNGYNITLIFQLNGSSLNIFQVVKW